MYDNRLLLRFLLATRPFSSLAYHAITNHFPSCSFLRKHQTDLDAITVEVYAVSHLKGYYFLPMS